MALLLGRPTLHDQDVTARVGRQPKDSTRQNIGTSVRAATPLRFDARLGASDELLWNIERDPSLRTTIVAVSVLDRAPDWERLKRRVAEACEMVPRLRERVVAAPLGIGGPRWQLDDHFDLTYHLRRVVAPEAGDLRAVLDIAGPVAMGVFDRDRPLWEFTLVEGLTAGRAAFIQKVHHSLTDGVGAIKLAELLLDDKRNPAKYKAEASVPARPSAGRMTMAVESMAVEVNSMVGATVRASARSARAMPGFAAKTFTDPARMFGLAVKQARSIGKLVAPVTPSAVVGHARARTVTSAGGVRCPP